MHTYKDVITLNRNSRGCYILDTVKGCSCVQLKPGGCYGDCYAKHIADRYGFDFSRPVKREFERNTAQLYFAGFSDVSHEAQIIREIQAAQMPFVRIGEMGDPSEDWEHTVSVCEAVECAGKPVVIITKHWREMSESVLSRFSGLSVVFNTSVSALDSQEELRHRLSAHDRLSGAVKSALRVVSCSFSSTDEGKKRNEIQDGLLTRDKVIDTIFRPSTKNPFLTSGIITAKKVRFLGAQSLASMHDEDAFIGYCQDCPEQCGIALF